MIYIIKQGARTMKKFVQKYRRAARDSKYEEQVLVKEFKREMNSVIKKKLMKVKISPKSIDQWYKCTTNLYIYWRVC